MSLSHFQRPNDIVHHPQFEPEVKRAILASWASDACAVEGNPSLRQPPYLDWPVPFDEVMGALRSLDGAADQNDLAVHTAKDKRRQGGDHV